MSLPEINDSAGHLDHAPGMLPIMSKHVLAVAEMPEAMRASSSVNLRRVLQKLNGYVDFIYSG